MMKLKKLWMIACVNLEDLRPKGMFELIYPLKNNINQYEKYYERIYPESQLLWKKLLSSNGEYD